MHKLVTNVPVNVLDKIQLRKYLISLQEQINKLQDEISKLKRHR